MFPSLPVKDINFEKESYKHNDEDTQSVLVENQGQKPSLTWGGVVEHHIVAGRIII